MSCSSNYSLESLFLFQILTKAKLLPSFLLPSNQAYVELRVGAKRHVCFSYIVKSKIKSEQKRVIQSDQEVQVCGYFWWMKEWTPLHDLSLSLYIYIFFLGHGLYFFLLFFFFDLSCGHVAYLLWVCIFSLFLALFFLCLLGMWHTFFGYASFISFCIAHIFDGNLGERVMIELGVLFCEWMEMLCYLPL